MRLSSPHGAGCPMPMVAGVSSAHLLPHLGGGKVDTVTGNGSQAAGSSSHVDLHVHSLPLDCQRACLRMVLQLAAAADEDKRSATVEYELVQQPNGGAQRAGSFGAEAAITHRVMTQAVEYPLQGEGGQRLMARLVGLFEARRAAALQAAAEQAAAKAKGKRDKRLASGALQQAAAEVTEEGGSLSTAAPAEAGSGKKPRT